MADIHSAVQNKSLTLCLFSLYYDVMSDAFSMYISHLTTRNPEAETIHGRLPACFINLKKTHICENAVHWL